MKPRNNGTIKCGVTANSIPHLIGKNRRYYNKERKIIFLVDNGV
jgi:hypothetical protein